MEFFRRKYPLSYHRGHYFRDTPLTMYRWHVMVLTVFMSARSLLRIKIYLKVKQRVYELLTLVKYSPVVVARRTTTYTRCMTHISVELVHVFVNLWHVRDEDFARSDRCYYLYVTAVLCRNTVTLLSAGVARMTRESLLCLSARL